MSRDHTSSFIKHGIKPDLLQEVPRYPCEVSYGSHKVEEGTELRVDQTKQRPSHISWEHNSSDERTRFTLLMVDPGKPKTSYNHKLAFMFCYIMLLRSI